ncbi:hypothetical protein DSO57_1035618 [Entomophthora muscae]|uniref:Uncharacterized protein n=2 Tax=Entomophthora muscae TaxID=34485 RepID=A0ACC2TLX7_9FUNG|nr:hypothetical protein DSO57_1035618 [Entomophthora muscae]
MNNNLFPNVGQNSPNVGQNVPQAPPSEQNRPQMHFGQNNLSQESSSAAPNVGSRFRFGTATNVVFGQGAPNEATRASAPPPRPIINRRRPGHQAPAAPKFVFNPNMPDEQVARLMAPLATNQPAPTVTPPSYNHLSLFSQPAAPDQVVNLFSNLRGRSDLGSYPDQIGTTSSQPSSTSIPVQNATMSMRATSNIGDYSTNPQQFTTQLPAVLATATCNSQAHLAPNDFTPMNGVQSQLTATSNNPQPNGPHLSLFPKVFAVPPPQTPTHKLDTSAASTPSIPTQMSQPMKVPDVFFEDKVTSFNKPLDFRRKAQVIGGARVHPCITFMNPVPDLPASVDPNYVKEMMTINLAFREAIVKLLDKNPFCELDDLVINMLEDISELDKRFPGCKATLAQLEPSSSKPNSKPIESSSFQSTSEAATTSFKPNSADNIPVSTPSFKPPVTMPIQLSSNTAPISKTSTEASTPTLQLSAAPHPTNPTTEAAPMAFQFSSSVTTTSLKDTSTPFQFSAAPASAPFRSAVTEGTAIPFQFSSTPSGFDAAKPTNSRKRVSEEEHEKRPMVEESPLKAAFSFKSTPGFPTNSFLTSVDAPKENSKLGMVLAGSSKVNFDSGSLSASNLGVSFGSTIASKLDTSSTGAKPALTSGTPITSRLGAPQLNMSFKPFESPTNAPSNLSVAPEASSSKPSFSFGLPNPSLFRDDSAKVSNLDLSAEPAQNKQDASTTQYANGSEDETIDEEGFKGTRTNDALILKGEGEEEENTLAQARVKLLTFDVSSKAYKDLGVGILKVNCHQTSGRRRLICRAEGSGHILMNSYIPDDINPEVVPKSSLKFKAFSLNGVPTLFFARIKELSDAKLLESAMGKNDN